MYAIRSYYVQQTVIEPVDSKPVLQGVSGPARTRPAVAVLPFDNLGAEPAQEYFADGMTDDVITRLAKNPGLMVIARDSSYNFV